MITQGDDELTELENGPDPWIASGWRVARSGEYSMKLRGMAPEHGRAIQGALGEAGVAHHPGLTFWDSLMYSSRRVARFNFNDTGASLLVSHDWVVHGTRGGPVPGWTVLLLTGVNPKNAPGLFVVAQQLAERLRWSTLICQD